MEAPWADIRKLVSWQHCQPDKPTSERRQLGSLPRALSSLGNFYLGGAEVTLAVRWITSSETGLENKTKHKQ